MAYYFTSKTDEFIIRFNEATEIVEKHRLFEEGIRPSFEKLVENLIYVYAYYTLDDVDTLKREGLAVLYEMLPKYDPSKGSKGFSYFNVIAKNWFVHKIREKSKKNRFESDLGHDIDHEIFKSDPSLSATPFEDAIEKKEKWLKLNDAMEFWKNRLKKKAEIQVLDAVIFLMRNSELVTIYNKKAVYLYLREITGLTTKQIVTSLKKIKNLYTEWNNSFNSDGESLEELLGVA